MAKECQVPSGMALSALRLHFSLRLDCGEQGGGGEVGRNLLHVPVLFWLTITKSTTILLSYWSTKLELTKRLYLKRKINIHLSTITSDMDMFQLKLAMIVVPCQLTNVHMHVQ